MSDPALKTTQFAHQRGVYSEHRDRDYFALFWEMGLGKSKLILDVASHLFLRGEINCLIIAAPNSVYRNWTDFEIPDHLAVKHFAVEYPKTNSRKHQLLRVLLTNPNYEPDSLRVLTVSYDAIGKTKRGFEFVMEVARTFDTMMVCDESTAIAKPKSRQTKRVKAIGRHCVKRWIATGTPATETPFNLHSQIEFLCPQFWGDFGLRTLTAFKSHFGIFQTDYAYGRSFKKVKEYRDLQFLNKVIEPISSRLLKEDSEVELPPKSYVTRTFTLTEQQTEAYENLITDYQAELDGGWSVSGALAIVRLARLQQICSGFVTAEKYPEDLEQLTKIPRTVIDLIPPGQNPRLLLLREIVDEARHKVIVWCRFTRDVDNICEFLGDTRAARFDGKTSQKERKRSLTRFRDPDDPCQVLVANVHALSHGVTLTIAKTMVYYTNDFSLEKRLQSEDRNHRIGQDSPVLIIDLAAERAIHGTRAKTVDHHVTTLLREKYDVAARVTNDRYREWIK